MIGFIYGALTGNFCGLLWEVVAYKRYFLKQPKFTSVNCCYVTISLQCRRILGGRKLCACS